MAIQRYRIGKGYGCNHWVDTIESPTGEYVKYEDVVALMKKHSQDLQNLSNELVRVGYIAACYSANADKELDGCLHQKT